MFWEGVISNNKCCKGVKWKEQNPPSSICFTKALWRCLQGAYSVGSIRPHREEIIKQLVAESQSAVGALGKAPDPDWEESLSQ